MSKKMLWALVLITMTVIVLIFNTNAKETVSLLLFDIRAMKSLIYLTFVGVGVVIGVLMR